MAACANTYGVSEPLRAWQPHSRQVDIRGEQQAVACRRAEASNAVVEARELVDTNSGVCCLHLADENGVVIASGARFDVGEVDLRV